MLIDRADFADLADLAAHRQAGWERQREYVAAASPLHRRAWGGAVPPRRLEDLAGLPLIDKEMLRRSQHEHPPFGDYLAAAPEKIARIHRTSGTTGTAMNLALSLADAHETAIVGGRAQAASGLGPGHRVLHCLNYRLWMGGFTDHATLEATGAAVVPFGVGETALLVRTIRELGVTAISCTPSYPAVLAQVIEDEFPGLELSETQRGFSPQPIALGFDFRRDPQRFTDHFACVAIKARIQFFLHHFFEFRRERDVHG